MDGLKSREISESGGERYTIGDVEAGSRLVERMLGTVIYQEEIGRLHMIKWEGPGIVVSEGWPSWSFALKAANCKRIFTVAKYRLAKVKEEFKATGLGETLVGSVEELWKLAA